MQTRLTLRPGQNGTKKLLERYGERLVRVRYLYDEQTQRRLKTVELIVEAVPWQTRARRPRRRDDEIIAVRIACHETDLRERAKRLGAIWRPAQKLREIRWSDAKRLGIAYLELIGPPAKRTPLQKHAGISRSLPMDGCIHQ